MVALVEELAVAGRRIGLLSNIPSELATHFERQQRYQRWLRHFPVRAFSCRIGHAKPHPAAYRWCQRALGLAPDSILFVDDREENVRAATALGMHGHLFIGPAQLRDALT
jgi:putative hydrolase of the HAD superfamily